MLEDLCQPLEDKIVTISLARGSLSFPPDFMLIAAMNSWAYGEQSRFGAEMGADLVRLTKQAASMFLPRGLKFGPVALATSAMRFRAMIGPRSATALLMGRSKSSA